MAPSWFTAYREQPVQVSLSKDSTAEDALAGRVCKRPVSPVSPSKKFAAETTRLPSCHRQLGSLQLLLGAKQGSTSSSPQIFFPARLGFLLYASFLSAKYLSIAALQSSTHW